MDRKTQFFIFILVLFGLRLISIKHPPLEVAHNWRQTTVQMVARNFLEVDANIFFPRVDMAGDKTGITGMEFPLLNYLIYICMKIFGPAHWYGRLINLIVSSIGLFYFFRLISLLTKDKDIAFYASFVLGSSIWFAYSRKIMPDTFSMSITICGLYYMLRYCKEYTNQFLHIVVGSILTVLGILSKIPCLYALVILLPFFISSKMHKKVVLSFVCILVVLSVGGWYFYWVPYLVDTYGYWHFFMGQSMLTSIGQIVQNILPTTERFTLTAIHYSGSILLLLGIYQCIVQKNWKTLQMILLLFFVFFIFVCKAGFSFYHHNYYIIPFVPVLSVLCAYGIQYIRQRTNKKWILVATLSIIFIEGGLTRASEFRLKDKNKEILQLENVLDGFSHKNDLIAINASYPTPMYFAHRKGWLMSNEDVMNATQLSNLKEKGCQYIIILKKTFGTATVLARNKIYTSEAFDIYKL